MSDRHDGGSAFPKYFGGNRDLAPGEAAGMSLRDYFAAQAMAAPWGEAVTPEVYPNGVVTAEAVAAVAANCYALADALLKERAR